MYYVSSRTKEGCESRRVPVKTEVREFEPVTIHRLGKRILSSSYKRGNRWYLNGGELSEDSQDIWASRPGVYMVRNYYQECLTEATFDFVSDTDDLLSVYPNPVEDKLIVEADFSAIDAIELINTFGQTVSSLDLQSVANKKMGIFEVANVKSGFYILRVISTDRSNRILGLIKK
jgi:hypothetical protein